MTRSFSLASLLILAACQSAPPVYELVVASEYDGEQMGLWATTVDTTSWERLVGPESQPYGPTFSPDGQTLAYTALADSFRTVFFLKDGVTTSPVVNGANGATAGGFSPDGSRFLYGKRTSQGTADIMVLDLETGASTQLTFTEDYNAAPSFTPDGGSMVHCRQHREVVDGAEIRNGDIFLTDLASGEVTRLTTDPAFDCLSDVSPDGAHVAYHSCSEAGCRIRMVGIDGADDHVIVDVEGSWPRYSPDGEWIAFTGTVDRDTDIWLVRPDGTELHAMTTGAGRDEVAAWKPIR